MKKFLAWLLIYSDQLPLKRPLEYRLAQAGGAFQVGGDGLLHLLHHR